MIQIGTSITGMATTLSTLHGISNAVGQERVAYTVGTSVEYGPFVEFGTSKMTAQPYLRPAAREVQGNITMHVKRADSLEGAVESAAMDVEARAKRYCPVDTGTLRASIRAQKQSTS